MATRGSGATMITSNPSQPFLFSVTMDSSKKKIKIQAKNKLKSEEQYYNEFTADGLKKIGFEQSVKGFYNRLKMAIESKSPDELKAYYNTNSNSLRIILEQIDKFDDEPTKWPIVLKKRKIEKKIGSSDSLTSFGSSSSINDSSNEAAMKQIQFVVKQVKEKFNNEKEERLKLEERIQALEQLCTKLTKKLVKVTNDLKKEKEKNNQHSLGSDDLFGSKEQKQQSPQKGGGGGVGSKGDDGELESKFVELKTNMETIEKKWGNELHIINQKMDDIRPKLVRLKTRRDFASEQAFIDYITNKLEQWDANKFGPILVRVMNNATGKAKHFIGYVGEPQKWNHTICKVQWFGLGKKLPEAVEWKALDVFLPLSSFYYPDCPHARAYGSRNDANKQQL